MLSFFHLPHTLHVRTPTDVALNTDVQWSEPTAYPCRIEHTNRLIRLADGQQTASTAVVYVVAEGLTTDSLYFLNGDPDDLDSAVEPISIQEHHHLATGQYSHSTIWI